MTKAACLIMMALMLVPATVRAQNESKEKAAVAAAQKWLSVVDSGQYAESWQQASAYFRNAVTREKWEQSLRGVRKPLGKLVSRKLKTSMYKSSLPGAPDGEYVVMQFDTSFAQKKSAVETVTMVLDKDGQWRVAGYFIM